MKNVFSTVKKVLATLAIVLPMAQTVNALEYRFKFKVTSSGPDMYACNAGVRTVPLKCSDVCYKENSDGTRTNVDRPGSCANTSSNCGSRIKCISTGTGSGESYMNYLKAGKRAWTDHSVAQAALSPVTKTGAANSYGQIVANSAAMDTKIEDLLFELGSEAYTAEYFVDICYRAPQHEYAIDGINANYTIGAEVNSTDFISNLTQTKGDSDRTGITMLPTQVYSALAAVKVKSYVVCETQSQAQDVANTTVGNTADFVIGADGLPVGGQNGNFFQASDLKSLSGTALSMISASVPNLRFCKVRYVFTETKGQTCGTGSKSGIFRDWTRQGAEMCTFTTINEPVVQ
jgi:hypothetical protein